VLDVLCQEQIIEPQKADNITESEKKLRDEEMGIKRKPVVQPDRKKSQSVNEKNKEKENYKPKKDNEK